MIDAICRRLSALDAVGLLDGPPCRGVVVGIDRDPRAKVTLLLFDARGEIAAVAKVARDARAEPALRAEHEALQRLAATSLGSLRRQVPAPLLLEHIAGRLVLASTAVSGAPMTVSYYTPGHVGDRHRVTRDFSQAGAWLVALARETAATTEMTGMAEAYQQHVLPSVVRYRQRLGCDDWEAAAFADLDDDARAFRRVVLPTPAVHGDYAIGNILLRCGNVVGVVDWERSRARGLPLVDVFKFAASYSSFLDRAAPPRSGRMCGHPGWQRAAWRWPSATDWTNLTGFMYGFFGDGWYPDLIRRFVDEHAVRRGVPPSLVPFLLRAFVVDQATALDNSNYERGYRALLRALHDMARRPPVGAEVRR